MKTRWKLLLAGGAVLLVLTALLSPDPAGVSARPEHQAPTPFPTPTPNAQGEILYTVQPGDTAWRVAAVAGISLEELYALNGLQDTDFLVEGQQLILGRVQPSQPTAAATDEAEVAPSATPAEGSGEICALLFEDSNGNARLEETEQPLNGGQVSIADDSGQVVGESATAEQIVDEEIIGVCFTGLDGGDYNVSGAVPEGYNPTTSMNAPLTLRPGEVKYVEFGAQASAALLDNPPQAGGGSSSLLGLLGVVLLLAAGGLGYYASRYGRTSSRRLR